MPMGRIYRKQICWLGFCDAMLEGWVLVILGEHGEVMSLGKGYGAGCRVQEVLVYWVGVQRLVEQLEGQCETCCWHIFCFYTSIQWYWTFVLAVHVMVTAKCNKRLEDWTVSLGLEHWMGCTMDWTQRWMFKWQDSWRLMKWVSHTRKETWVRIICRRLWSLWDASLLRVAGVGAGRDSCSTATPESKEHVQTLLVQMRRRYK